MFYIFYIVYKITNMVNGKIYIGVHKTNDLNDDYMGSGKLLKRAQKKYGIENFEREYLYVFDNAEDMFKMESEIVNEEFIARKDTYNLKLGGFGGWDHINSDDGLRARLANENYQKGRAAGTAAGIATYLNRLNEDEDFRNAVCDRLNRASKLGVEKLRSVYESGWTFSNKTHSAETKAKMSEKGKLRTGDKNSQFGTMWITNPESGESKKITRDDLIPDGWVKGSNIKNTNIMWIMNSESGESKRINKDTIIPDGWVKGRKIKNSGK